MKRCILIEVNRAILTTKLSDYQSFCNFHRATPVNGQVNPVTDGPVAFQICLELGEILDTPGEAEELGELREIADVGADEGDTQPPGACRN